VLIGQAILGFLPQRSVPGYPKSSAALEADIRGLPKWRVPANYRGQDTLALTPGETMGIGAGIVLIAVGAILAFAVNFSVSGIEISTIGFILMVAGVIGIVVALVMNGQRSRTRHTIVRDDRPPPGDAPLL